MRSFLALPLALLFCGVGSTGARAESTPIDKDYHLTLSPEELTEVMVLSDGGGHYIAVTKPSGPRRLMFYGDATSMHSLSIQATFSEEANLHSWTVYSPRMESGSSFLQASGDFDAWSFRCGERSVPLLVVDDKTRETILAGEFRPEKWQRHPYLLSRDSRGVYYYVDDLLGDAQDMRLFVGRPGKMTMQKLLHTVSDSEGDILFVKNGKLRLDGLYGSKDRKVTWIQGKKRTELLHLAEQADAKLIYNVLGVYEHEHLGNPCEDF